MNGTDEHCYGLFIRKLLIPDGIIAPAETLAKTPCLAGQIERSKREYPTMHTINFAHWIDGRNEKGERGSSPAFEALLHMMLCLLHVAGSCE